MNGTGKLLYNDYVKKLKETGKSRKAKYFMEWFSNRYDDLQGDIIDGEIRAGYGIDIRLGKRLLTDYKKTKGENVRWYMLVGPGGSGKSLLAINIGYWLDKKLDIDSIVFDWKNWVSRCMSFPMIGAKRSLVMDEPDKDDHSLSKFKRKISVIMGKQRQQQLFHIFCATTFRHSESFVVEKVNAIIYTPHKGEAWVFADNHEKGKFVITKLKDAYMKKGFEAFKEYQNYALKVSTKGFWPLSEEARLKYLEKKMGDLKRHYEEAQSTIKKDDYKKPKEVSQADLDQLKRYYEISALIKNGKSQKEVAKIVGLSQPRINQILKQYKPEDI